MTNGSDDDESTVEPSLEDTIVSEIQKQQLWLLQRQIAYLESQRNDSDASDSDDEPQTLNFSRPGPIHSLPIEIISEIFRYCRHNYANIVDSRYCPLLLLRVCRLWRDVALSTPALWTTLNLHLNCDRWETGKTPDVEALARVVDRWLLRAGSRPLDICLADLTEGSLDPPALRPLLQTLQRHSHRIGTFCMELYPDDFSLFEGHRMEFSQLVELSIASEDIEGSGPILRTFRDAPCLRKVHLSRLPLGSITVPREQIEEFSGRGCGAEEYLDALQALPKLTTCLLQPYLIDYDRDELPIITHTRLRRLTLEERDDEIFGFEDDDFDDPRPIHILSFLTLPALESLELDGTQSFDGEILRAFVERSSPPLRKLSIAYDSGSLCITGSLDAFLLLPCLEDLAFGSPAPKLVTQFCALLARNPSCLPRLKSLEITNEDESLSNVPSWVREVGNALLGRASSSLESVRIVLGGEFTKFRPRKSLDALMLFASLTRREKGVKVHFGTKDMSAF